MNFENKLYGTTVLALKHSQGVIIAGDGQVTMGNIALKRNARKVRKIYNGKVLAAFAGSTADAFTLFERFEAKLETFSGNLLRSSVELAKDWRTDKVLRKLEAMLVVGDGENLLLITGNGDVIEPEDDVVAIGSGGPYALSAAKALLKFSNLSPREIIEESMKIASELCIYTNSNFVVEEVRKSA